MIINLGSREVVRRQFRHKLSLDLAHFSAGRPVWRARCSCGWRASVKVDDADAATTMALAHTQGFVMGAGIGGTGDLL